jgi:hypothetical protein
MDVLAPGSVIRNRSRLWRVDGQEGDVLIATSIDGGEAEQTKFYAPFEDIRPGRLEPPSADIVGHPSAQDLLLRAYRLSLLHGTAPLLSLQRSRVIPKDYQLVPVVMALEMDRVRMLIADDVGLGKTIEAGLIITELLARQMASRLLVIVPANLREQWREALDYFFHIPARIISTRHRREMERELPASASPWEHYGRTTCVVTPDVEEVTALFHLLARYVVNTEPTSIVEELLPVAVTVYGDHASAVGCQKVVQLLNPRPSPETRTEAEVREALADALAIEGLDVLLEKTVEARRQEVVAERRDMRRQMEGRADGRAAEWLRGIDDLLPGSFDILALTLFWPS